MRRCGLRFGLLGPPVLYDRALYGISYSGGYGADGPGDGAENDRVVYDTALTHDTGDRSGSGPAVRAIGSPKVRALLAALLLEAGRVVSVESLKDALWGGAPPASAQASLHNHVARLRRLLDEPERLRAVAPGYLLRVDEGELDVHVFDARVAEARAAHARRDWAEVLRACAAALALWRGTPLSGVSAELGGYAFVQRLEEARLLLIEWRYDAELAVGGTRLSGLVPELAALVAEHPLREAYHRQLMLALHRTDRQAEALAVHRDLRTRLVEELGIEPGPAIRAAHVEVLRGFSAPVVGGAGSAEPSYDGRPGAVAVEARAAQVSPAPEETPQRQPSGSDDQSRTGGEARRGDENRTGGEGGGPDTAEGRVPGDRQPAPAQLPPPPAHFTGRTPELHELRSLLVDPKAPAVAVITGMAGVGKSALALHAAHRLRERFPDGQLYVNLHGATPGVPPLAPSQALAALLRDLGAESRSIPEHPDAAAALLRSILAPTRTLMVLDDAANAAQVRPLLPAGPGCAVIVTSRSPLTTLDGARRFPLGPLTGEDSAALLRAVSGRDGLHAGHPLVGLTGRLPLALRVVAARLAARSALTPDVLAVQLAATEGRLHHLEYDDLSVRRSLAVAHDALAASEREADRDAALALRRLGALDLPAYGAPLLARLTGTDERRAEAALDRLLDVALLEETAYGRYAPHDLVRDFARELAGADAATGDGTDAAVAALRWYAAVAERALTAIVEPGLDQDDRRRPTAAQPPGHAADVAAVPPFDSAEQAFAWGDVELENIVALVERHADALPDASPDEAADEAPDEASDASPGSSPDVSPYARPDVQPADPTAAGAPDDRTAAHLSTLIRLVFPYVQRRGRVAEMEVLGRAALGTARRLGDEAAEAYALGDLAGLHFLTGRQNDALRLNDQALVIWRHLGTRSWIRRCLNNRGLLLEGLGRYAESEDALRQSLEYSRRLKDPYGEAVTLSHLGNLYEHTDPRAAIEQHRRSLAIGNEIGAVIVQHSAHCNMGYAHLTLGEPAAAAANFEESLRILGGHGDWHGESQTRLGLVRALRRLGHAERAWHECAELLRRAEDRADRYMGGLARHQYGLLLRGRGCVEEANDEWRAALSALDGTDAKAVVAELRELLGGTC
ncbi:BTAD domain-containing putative transcriptional regulator [Streptomyces sp. NPDC001406]|uniref:AfsR/SARP family transcriptional regulator n=1 Tax=Streptomyces sp. NPDC001406 TaxID=3364572 RepID=UPI0036C277E1